MAVCYHGMGTEKISLFTFKHFAVWEGTCMRRLYLREGYSFHNNNFVTKTYNTKLLHFPIVAGYNRHLLWQSLKQPPLR